jgi:serine carboxypeptidase-like clade 1
VGNGCWGSKVGLCQFGSDMQRIQAQFLYGHGAVSAALYKQIIAECGDPMAGPMTWAAELPPKCADAVSQMHASSGDFEIYNYYDQCYGTTGITQQSVTMTAEDRSAHIAAIQSGAPFGAGAEVQRLGGALNDYPCGGQRAMKLWLALPEVQAALHVKNGTAGMAYGPRDRDDLRPLYAELAKKYRVVIYSGDVDACVPFVGTEEWTSALAFPVVEEWRPWLAGTAQNASARIAAGYVTTYAAAPNHNFSFITIKGAGHMVPQFKPVSALQFIERFFHNEPF